MFTTVRILFMQACRTNGGNKENLMLHFCGDDWPKAFDGDGGGRQVGSNGASFLRFYSDTHPARYDTSKSTLQQEFA